MVQIIEDNRPMSTRDRFAQAFANLGQGVGQGVPSFLQGQQQQKASQADSEYLKGLGIDLQDPELRKIALSEKLKGQNQAEERNYKKQEEYSKLQREMGQKAAPYIGALETVDQMRQLREGGRLGRMSPLFNLGGGKTSEDIGKYEQLGKSLISYATSIPIRNRLEFETLADDLYDSSISDAKAKGILDSMERIIRNSLSEYQMPGSGVEDIDINIEEQVKPKKSLKNFWRK